MSALALTAYLSLFGADAASTDVALRSGRFQELYLTQSPSANDAIVAGQAAALYWATAKIKRPALRWTIRLSIAGLHGYAAYHNLQRMKR